VPFISILPCIPPSTTYFQLAPRRFYLLAMLQALHLGVIKVLTNLPHDSKYLQHLKKQVDAYKGMLEA
jgi:hypothetical protein